MIVEPHLAVRNVGIIILNTLPKSNDLEKKGIIPIQYFEKDFEKNMGDIIFQLLPEYDLGENKFI